MRGTKKRRHRGDFPKQKNWGKKLATDKRTRAGQKALISLTKKKRGETTIALNSFREDKALERE